MISQKDKDGNKTDDAKDFSALWFKLGGGLDYSLTSNIYLRGEVLYGIRLVNNNEKDAKKIYSEYPGVDAKTLLGHGPEVKLAVGYKF
jgi:opacity protein-like surface antigen